MAHLSTARALELVRRAKAEGLAVTCEVTPHHLVLTDEEVAASGFSTRTKMNPPLREASDLTALVAGILDGTIDAIATDHAPAPRRREGRRFRLGPVRHRRARDGGLRRPRPARARGAGSASTDSSTLFSAGPARVFGLPGGTLAPGAPADVTLFDPEARWKVDPHRFLSKGRSTPFAGWELSGAPAATIVGGEVVWQRVEL